MEYFVILQFFGMRNDTGMVAFSANFEDTASEGVDEWQGFSAKMNKYL